VTDLLAVHIGQSVIGAVVVLCAWLILKRLNFLTAMLMRESMKTAADTRVTASALAVERKETAQKISDKVEKVAAEVKGALHEQRQVSARPSVINMEVKKMDVHELNVPKKEDKGGD